MARLTETYADEIFGALCCFKSVIITGSLVESAYTEFTGRGLGTLFGGQYATWARGTDQPAEQRVRLRSKAAYGLC